MPTVTAAIPSSNRFSTELHVALAPDATFQHLIRSRSYVHGWRALRRPALVLLLISVLAPIMAVQRVTIALVATAALTWCFVLAIQTLVAVGVISSAPARRVPMAPALDLWFAGHLPYSLWMLVAFGVMAESQSGPLRVFVSAAVVPAVWTAIIVASFCRRVLGTTGLGACWRTAVYVIAVWAIALSYIAWGAGGWFQLLPPR
ncbi:MAG TPA: hypothetical protein VGF24_24895 [Vicinamibacterales bacterium]|jgi:hypothetical protein